MTTVGIIGAGNIGSTLARGLVARRYDVVISNSRGPETLHDLAEDLGPTARAGTALEAAAAGDWVIVAMPLRAIDDVPVSELVGKVVLDANNYYPQRDGQISALDDKRATTSQLLQDHLPDSKVAKAFNTIRSGEILAAGRPSGAANRRALPTSSDHPDAAAFVRGVYDEFGFDTVEIGPLAESWRAERDQPSFVVRLTAPELEAALAQARR